MNGKYAKAYWKRITAELVKIEAITDLHLEALEALCRQWDDYRRLSDWCEQNPDDCIIAYDSGHIAEHPNLRLRQIAYTNCTKLWPKFGLTPEGLARVSKSNPAAKASRPRNGIQDFAAGKFDD